MSYEFTPLYSESITPLFFTLALFYPPLLGAGLEGDAASSGHAVEKPLLRAMMSDSSMEAQSLQSLAKSNTEIC